MNNGQNNQSENAYFTPGVGNLPVNQNQETIPNLNINESVWRPERDHRDIGENVISSMEITQSDQPQDQNPEMGKIIPLEPTRPPEPAREETSKTANVEVIRTEGDRISKAALSEVRRTEVEFAQTGNASNFYDEVRSMMEANLDNSYNRKLAA